MENIESLKKDIETGKVSCCLAPWQGGVVAMPCACNEQKRQAAQLRRMQRLVGEAQAHRRQWAERANQLKASIRQVKERIEE